MPQICLQLPTGQGAQPHKHLRVLTRISNTYTCTNNARTNALQAGDLKQQVEGLRTATREGTSACVQLTQQVAT
jgi:DICT domain-containing protein